MSTKLGAIHSADDNIYIDVIHFTNKDKAKGFRHACGHLGIEPEKIRSFKDEQGVFILLTRDDNKNKKGHIIYRSSKRQQIENLQAEIECEYIAAFDSSGETAPIKEIDENLE